MRAVMGEFVYKVYKHFLGRIVQLLIPAIHSAKKTDPLDTFKKFDRSGCKVRKQNVAWGLFLAIFASYIAGILKLQSLQVIFFIYSGS